MSQKSLHIARKSKSGHSAAHSTVFDMGITPDPLLCPKVAAQHLGVKPKFVYERIARGEIPALYVGRLRRIRLSALETWLSLQQEV